MRIRRWLVAVPALALCVALSACTRTPPKPQLPDATATAGALASALITGDWSAVQFSGSSADAVKDYGVVTAGLSGARPATVTYGGLTYDTASNTATVQLDQTYGFSTPWTFTSVANLRYAVTNGWQVDWSPSIVNPSLDGYTRLTISTSSPKRGQILAGDGTAIVWNRPVFNVGIDKTKVSGDQQAASARALATLVGIDPDAYAKQVANGGPQQFVVAITYRAGQVPDGLDAIPGAWAQPDTMSLGPSRTFAIGLLGTAGEATAEDIEKSHGTVHQGDIIGKSGLQASQNATLTGSTGYTVYLAPRAAGDVMTPPSAIGPTSSASSQKQVLFEIPAIDGADLHTTLNIDLQTKAETILAGQAEIASLVVLDQQTGAILVAANSPAAGANSYAMNGQYAPGSTFKIATALALLRSGMTPDSTLDCPTSVTVNGKPFSNDSDYPPAHNGTITLLQAVAYSCNTAMINGGLTLGPSALPDAAASLGLGTKPTLGVANFMGSVPPPKTDVERAADSFGQGNIAMSPLAMATEAASVAAGRTITPYLIADPKTGQPWQSPAPSGSPGTPGASASGTASPEATPTPTAAPVAPLTPEEAASLRGMMAAVVDVGTGTGLKGLADGAKTGTAEFTNQDGQTLAHAWMIAYNSRYAIAAFVNVGDFGATTAGPLVKAFLS